jgi:putative toxin-antitoxin system antitoxin component (TIGR02293 family)
MAAPRIKELGDLLGGGRSEGLAARVREGLPFRAFEALLAALGLTAPELAALVGVAPRTLARRKAARRLSPIESDRLYRVAHVAFQAVEVLGSLEKARAWLHRDNAALGGTPPLRELDTDIGARRVEEVLQRLAFGVYS